MERFKGYAGRTGKHLCEALARHYENTPLGEYFLELAEQWRQLADQTERSESRVKS
jgi:hypothetical protein